MNLIPLGDHCAISIILTELKLRKCSYPFDWTTHTDQLHNTNIFHNFNIIKFLLETNNATLTTLQYLGNATHDNKIHNDIWFPHDFNSDTTFSTYQRRFERLCNHIKTGNNIYIMLTRHKFIEQVKFNEIYDLLCINGNKIMFISGTEHEYLTDYPNVIYKYIHYDITKFYDYDTTHFRPAIKEYLDITLNQKKIEI